MYNPYSYQSECLTALEFARLNGEEKASVVMASGLGKTISVAFDMNYWLQKHGGRILYLCHQNEILHQSKNKIHEILGDEVSYGFYHGREKTAHKVDCLFASFQTMTRNLQLFKPDEFAYIVVDESHHSAAATYQKVVEYFRPKFLLGLTATPDRMDGQDIRRYFGEPVYFLPLEEALGRDLLTPVDYRLISDEISFEKIVLINFLKVDELTIEDIDKELFIPKTDEEIQEIIKKHAGELSDPRIMIFAGSISRADELSQSIPGSVPIHSQVKMKDRILRLEMFRTGLVKTIITVDCFNEGVDIPEANLIVFLRSTISQTIFLQQLGRGLRKCEGKDKVIVLDFVGNCDRIARVKELSDSIQNVRKKLTDASDDIPRAKFNFDEKIGKVLELAKKSRLPRVADYPELLEEYSPRNAKPASQMSSRVQGKLWWKCKKCGYEYMRTIREKKLGDSCSKCENSVSEFNSLGIMYPFLVQEYSEKNPVSALNIRSTSKDFVFWKCRDCGYEWKARPYSRTQRGDSCPSCSREIKHFWYNLAFFKPELLEEYSYINKTSPEKLSMRSNVMRWWICKRCNATWQATASGRSRGLAGCPNGCSNVREEDQTIVFAYPHLAKEYSSSNRQPIEKVTANLQELIRWFCDDCGRYWRSTVQQRVDGTNCPHCSATVSDVQLENKI